MIRTKFLEMAYGLHEFEGIDDLINEFLAENQGIEVVDIKFQSNVSAVADSGVSGTYWHTSALIIYKEPEKSMLGIEFGEE